MRDDETEGDDSPTMRGVRGPDDEVILEVETTSVEGYTEASSQSALPFRSPAGRRSTEASRPPPARTHAKVDLGAIQKPVVPRAIAFAAAAQVADRESADRRVAASKVWTAPVSPADGAPPLHGNAWAGVREASDVAASRSREAVSESKASTQKARSGMFEDGEVRRHALVDLLAFDAALPGRLRRSASFRAILGAATARPAWVATDEPRTDESREGRDRMDVLRALSFSEPSDLPRVRELVEQAFGDALQLELPLAVMTGHLKPTYDEVEVLRATAQIGLPLATTNRSLQTAIKVVEEAIGSGPPPSVEATQTLLRQVAQASGSLSGYLQTQVQRVMLEGRHYKRRTILGETRIRAELSPPSGEAVPIYVSEAVSSKLPMLPSFVVAVIVELRPREDAQETHSEALVAHALGRVVRLASA